MKLKEIKNKKCLFCSKLFLPSRKDERIKYCSKKCRERHWRKLNKLKVKEYGFKKWKEYQKKNPIYCRYCKKEIPLKIRKSGLVFCSDSCRKNQSKLNSKKSRDKSFKVFRDYKENNGCLICGYNKYYGSLDFHHINPKEKDLRITAQHFISQSELIKKELSKCILVCKNCHHELHNLIRTNLKKYNSIIKKIL